MDIPAHEGSNFNQLPAYCFLKQIFPQMTSDSEITLKDIAVPWY
jgi:hypothetical protein